MQHTALHSQCQKFLATLLLCSLLLQSCGLAKLNPISSMTEDPKDEQSDPSRAADPSSDDKEEGLPSALQLPTSPEPPATFPKATSTKEGGSATPITPKEGRQHTGDSDQHKVVSLAEKDPKEQAHKQFLENCEQVLARLKQPYPEAASKKEQAEPAISAMLAYLQTHPAMTPSLNTIGDIFKDRRLFSQGYLSQQLGADSRAIRPAQAGFSLSPAGLSDVEAALSGPSPS